MVDEPIKDGGDDKGPSPQELLAASLASCTAITIEMYAKQEGLGHRSDRGRVRVHASRARFPTEFKITLWLPEDLSEEQVERLNAIAAKCPVHRTLEGGATITQSVATTARR